MLLGGLLFALTFTIVLKQAQMEQTDYQQHMVQAAYFRSMFPYHISYPMWHFLVYIVFKGGWYLLGNMPLIFAGSFVTAAVNVAVFVIIQRILARRYQISAASLAAFALCLVMPIYIPWYNNYLYRGQISPVTWHNPTNLMVKPFALLVFFLVADICQDIRDDKPIKGKRYIILAALAFCSMLAKPSFFQGFVPALGIYILICLICTRFRKWKEYLLLCLAFVPSFGMMVLQFYFAFLTGSGEGISIGWMDVFSQVAPSPVVSTFLGIIFPVAYILLNLKKSMKNIPVQLSLLFAFFGWLEFAMIYENGERMFHCNFMWASMLAYSVLWVVTTGMFFRDVHEMDLSNKKAVAKNTFIFVLWILHLICGIYYIWYLLSVPDTWM